LYAGDHLQLQLLRQLAKAAGYDGPGLICLDCPRSHHLPPFLPFFLPIHVREHLERHPAHAIRWWCWTCTAF